MKILITGSTGFVGRHLMPKLIDEGHEILEITRDTQKSEMLFGDRTCKYQITDNQTDFNEQLILFNPEIVIHLAAYLNSNDDFVTQQKLIDSNILFFARLLDALRNTTIKLFINTGTFAEYANGDNVLEPAYFYAATKTASRAFLDFYSKLFNFKQITVVPYTIYGGIDTQKKIIDLIIDSLDNPIPFDLSPGGQVLDFVHISDVVDFYVKLIQNMENLPVKSNFQLGTGVGHTIRAVAEMIERLTQKKANINWGGKSYRTTDVMYAVANTDNFFFKYTPIELTNGLEKYFL